MKLVLSLIIYVIADYYSNLCVYLLILCQASVIDYVMCMQHRVSHLDSIVCRGTTHWFHVQ